MTAQEKIDPTQANLSRLAIYFQLGRDTIRKKLELACIIPTTTIGQAKYYSIADAATAVFGATDIYSAASDPDELKPSDQKDYWMAKQRELEYKQSIGTFLHQDDVRASFRALAESLSEKIQSFPDVLERDEGLEPRDVDRMIKLCDRLSITLHDAFSESCS